MRTSLIKVQIILHLYYAARPTVKRACINNLYEVPLQQSDLVGDSWSYFGGNFLSYIAMQCDLNISL